MRRIAESNGAKTINTVQATIQTFTVQVKALTINNKQVTLAVFRQLPQEPLIDPDKGQLRGLPWGRVNYYVGDCSDACPARHLHVIWQRGDELHRACVLKNPWQDYQMQVRLHNLETVRFAAATALALCLGLRQCPADWQRSDEWEVEGWKFSLNERAFQCLKSFWRTANDDLSGPGAPELASCYQERRKEVEEALRKAISNLGSWEEHYRADEPAGSLVPIWDAALKQQRDLETEWERRWAELSALDQLYIAV